MRVQLKWMWRRWTPVAKPPSVAWDTEFCARAAESASAASDFFLAMVLWERVYSRTNDVSDMVRRLECARLAGVLQFHTEELAKISGSEILTTLTPAYAAELLQERDDARPFEPEECATIANTVERPPKQITVRRSARAIDGHLSHKVCQLPLPTPWDCAEASQMQTFDKPYVADVPEINGFALDRSTTISTTIRAGGVLCLSNVAATISSDVMHADGRMFGDYYTWPDAVNNRPANDARVVDVRRPHGEVSVTTCENSQRIDLDAAIWLAYPMSWAWGHWVRDILTRYCYLLDGGAPPETPIIVDKRVPPKSLDFLRMMNPHAKIVPLPAGSDLLVKRLWLSPSRIYAAHNPRWSSDEIDRRVNAEPQSFRRLRVKLLRASEVLSRDADYPKNIYLDRSLGEQSRGLRDESRFRNAARANGFTPLEPGSLNALQQVQAFSSAKSIVGLDGSGWFFGSLSEERARCLIVGHDLSRDSRGRSWMLEEILGVAPQWIVGRRRHAVPGYADALYHQEFVLSDESWSRLESALLSLLR